MKKILCLIFVLWCIVLFCMGTTIDTGGSGDITKVSDCASGDCLDGSATGGSYVRIYDGDSNYIELDCEDVSANYKISLPTTVGSATQVLQSDGDNTTSWTSSGTGTVTGAGDCSGGLCLDGTSDGGEYIRIYDGDSHYMELDVEDISADYKISLPTTVGTAGQTLQSDGDNTTSWSSAGSGTVTKVGDCESGDCLDGTSDGGSYVRIYDGDSNYMELDVENISSDYKISLPTTVGSSGQVLQSDGDNTTSWSTPTDGDVTKVGDCASGECYDGSSDGGTYVRLYDGDSNYTSLVSGNVSSDITITMPTSTSTLLATDGAGTNLTALNGENIQNDTIDDDSIDFVDVTLADLTFDVGSVSTTEYGYLDGVGSAIQTQIDNAVLSAGNCTSGACYDGTSDGGTYIGLYDGDSNYTEIVSGDVSATTTITLPTSTCTLLATNGVGTNLTALNGENIQNDTIDDDSIDFADVTLADLTFDVGSVDTTEYGYLNGVTDSIQTQIDSKDGVSVDSGATTNPDFVSTGDIDFVNSSNTISANINGSTILATDLANDDWGDISVNTNSATLDNDVVSTDEMANADHGHVSWSSGSATVEDFALDAAADGGDQNITNLGDLSVDTVKADDASVTIGDSSDDIHIAMDGSPDSNDTYSGISIRGLNAGESVSQWDLVFLNSADNELHKADADEASHWPARGMAVAAGTDGNELIIITQGIVRNDEWNFSTVGGTIFLDDTTAGSVTQTAPSTSGDCVQVVGWAISDDEIYVNISGHYLEVE